MPSLGPSSDGAGRHDFHLKRPFPVVAVPVWRVPSQDQGLLLSSGTPARSPPCHDPSRPGHGAREAGRMSPLASLPLGDAGWLAVSPCQFHISESQVLPPRSDPRAPICSPPTPLSVRRLTRTGPSLQTCPGPDTPLDALQVVPHF